MKAIFKYIILFLIGGFIYYGIEVLWRGYSHISMFIVAGILFLIIGGLNNWLPWKMPLQWQCICGAALVTLVEFAAGVILNLWLKLGIWDYSNLPFNFKGQICLPFSLIWIVLSLIAILIDDFLRWRFFKEEKPHYTF